VLAVSALASVVAAPVWSHRADRRTGTVATLRLALILTAVLAIGLWMTGPTFVAIASVAAALAAAQSPQTPSIDALTVATLGPKRLRDYGSFRLWASAGWGCGAIAFGALFQVLGLGWMLPMYAVALVIAALYVGRFRPTRAPVSASDGGARFGAVGEALTRVPMLALFVFGVVVFGASTHAAWDFVPLRIASGGGGPFLVGVAAGVSAFVEIPIMRSSGSLLDRYGVRAVFLAGGSVYVAASLVWAAVSAPLAVAAVRIAIGIGFGLTYVTLVIMTGTLVPPGLRNTGQTLLQVASWGLAPVVGSLVGGIVYQRLGATPLFLGSAVGIVVGMAIVWNATRRLGGPAPG
jgi:PPP family 3-phenylpropionic acid transporter